jgi:galactokinase
MFIPGRIEILGKHTDYCGGRSIVCAIDRGFRSHVEPRVDSTVVLESTDSSETISFDLAANSITPAGHWVNYAFEVGQRLTKNFANHQLKGATIRFQSDLPKAAGLSSSSALMIMVFAALESVNELRETAAFGQNITNELELAEYLGRIENGQSFRELKGSAGVGTFGGSQDHAAILLGRAGVLSRFSFSPLTHESDFVFPEKFAFVVASSGVAAEKTGAARERYNRVSRMVSEITEPIGNGKTLAQTIDETGIDALRSIINKGQFSFTTGELLDRIEQFRIENFEIIPAISELLAVGEIDKIGDLIDLSQQNAERFLGNQIEETVFLQRIAREIGAIAASAFGAGFGGSVYAIVRSSDAEHFRSEWRRSYVESFPQHRESSEFFITRPSQASLTGSVFPSQPF